MKVTVVKSYHDSKQYTIEIQQKHQYFRLDYEASRRDCIWMARMFRLALKRHVKEKISKK